MSNQEDPARRRWPTIGQTIGYVLGLAALSFFIWSMERMPAPAASPVAPSATPVECRCRCVIEGPDPRPHRPAEGEEDL
jgi:hypothetical protein